MKMKPPYRLKNIQKKTAYEEVCLSASIWYQDKEIGKFCDCPDTGKPLFSFNQLQDRMDFEAYIQSWWAESEQVYLCNLHLRELVDLHFMQELPLHTKMRCWISLETSAIEIAASWKWKSRTARDLVHSLQSYTPGSRS